MTIPQRYQGGSWDVGEDINIFYDGAWQNPCAGPKTIWHYINGAWVEFDCGASPNRIYMNGSPIGEWNNSIIMMNPDGSLFPTGNKVTRLTSAPLSGESLRDMTQIAITRDYANIYTIRSARHANTNAIKFFQGASIEISPNAALTLPIWVEFELAFDGFNQLSSHYSDLSGDELEVLNVQYDNSSIDHIGIVDLGATGAYNGWKGNHAAIAGSTISGNIDDTQWHTVRYKITDFSGQCQLTIDGTPVLLPSVGGGGGQKLAKVIIGLMCQTHTVFTGGYVGRIMIGTTVGGSDIMHYEPKNDGYLWQDQTDVSPGYNDYPDERTPNKGYSINLVNSNDIDFGNPNYADPTTPSGIDIDTFFEVWKLRQDGIDSTSSDTSGFPSDRLLKVPTTGARPQYVEYDSHVSVTDNGLELSLNREEVTDGTGFPVSLYRYDFATSSFVFLKSGLDFSSAQGRYAGFGANFSPSGNKVGWFKAVPPYAPGVINRDGTGYVAPLYGGLNAATLYAYWNPADESYFLHLTLTTSPLTYSLVKIHLDGTTSPDVLFTTATNETISSQPKTSPDASLVGFLSSFQFPHAPDATFRTMAHDGSGLVTYNIGAAVIAVDPSLSAPQDFAWSKDGTQIIVTIVNGEAILKYTLATDTIEVMYNNGSDSLFSAFIANPIWFHGWSDGF